MKTNITWHVSIPDDVDCPCPHEFTETCTREELDEDLHRYGVLGKSLVTSLTIRRTLNEETGKTVWEWLYERDGEFLCGGYCNTFEDAVHNAMLLKPTER